MIATEHPPSSPGRRRLLVGGAGLLATGLGVTAGPAAFRALAGRQGLQARTRAGLGFGTIVSITVAGEDQALLDAALRDTFAALRGVEAAASLFRGDSALTRLNREGVLHDPDPHLVALLRFALDLARETGGAFDPSVQPLWTLWSGAVARDRRPSEEELSAARAHVDWQSISLEEDRIALRPGMGVTLNALLQGYAADVAMAVVARHGLRDAFIDTGEFGARGAHADGTPWRLGIADPRREGEVAEVMAPFSGFAATSGDYAMSFSADHADHHIFDPTTGRSPRALCSVTVTAPSGLVADGLSTAAFVLGPEAGQALIARYPGCTMRSIGKA
jgi:thiamine biosynthesis lipoprotein